MLCAFLGLCETGPNPLDQQCDYLVFGVEIDTVSTALLHAACIRQRVFPGVEVAPAEQCKLHCFTRCVGFHTTRPAQVAFYDPSTGREQQAFDYSGDDGARNFACAAVNPAGDAAVVGAFNRLYVFARGGPKGAWQQAGVKQVWHLPLHDPKASSCC